MVTANDVRKLIKDFTKKSPPDTWEGDPAYRHYLATCEKLLRFDLQLLSCEDQETLEKIYSEVKSII